MDPNAKTATNTQQQQPADEQNEAAPTSRDEINALVNSAVSNHLKRAMGGLNATIEQAIAKALASTKQEPQGEPSNANAAQTQAQKDDPRIKTLEQQLAELKRKNDEAEARAAGVERKSKQDTLRTSLREALEARGIKGAKARAVIADFESSGSIRFADDGRVEGVVRRVRVKGGKPEELTHEDPSEFVNDWSQSDEAKEFLPPPAAAAPKPPTGRPAPANGSSKPLNYSDAIAKTVADLNNQ